MAGQAELRSEELYGIAKKMNAQLEDLPLHQHSAVVEMVKVGMQARALGEQHAAQQAQREMQERQLAATEAQIKLAQEQAQRQRSEEMKPHLVEQPN